ncbi:MAG TPA: carboxypeptidase regulatory-like domain-containing protein [Gemmatimonadaceae bacterium]|nr:carboxypeptidase regulatory-like domain-containing protein [Gemmatimonadaceae bacterium]
MSLSRAWVPGLLGLLLAARLGAQQQPAAASPYAVLAGVVVDSIHGGPLVGAIVVVSGTDRQATVDTTGRFRMDSIPPGDHELGVFHPLLDSLNISVGSKNVTLGAGQVTSVVMATPSAPTVVAVYCSETERQKGPGAVVGRVLTPDSDDPVADATVRYTATWKPLKNLTRNPAIVGLATFIEDAKSKQDGAFVLCGLPTIGSGTVHATRGQVVTGDMAANVSKWLVATVTVRLDTVKRGTAVVVGRIVDEKGAPVPHVDVARAGSHIKTATGDSGRFALRDLPAGSQTIQVRKVGFTATDTALMLSSKSPVEFAMTLHSAAVTLSKVNVDAAREAALERVGFEHRRKAGFGHFLTADDANNRGAVRLSDLARTIPGLIVRETRSGQQVILQGRGKSTSNRGCVAYMVDNAPFYDRPLGSIDDVVRPEDIIGLEVYDAAEAPPALVVAPMNCSVIVIWTKATSGGD